MSQMSNLSLLLGEIIEHGEAILEAAKEGTDAHNLCEYKVLTALGRDAPDSVPDLEFYSGEMETCASEYCSYVMEQLKLIKQNCSDPQVMVEQRLDFSRWVPDGFGTGDCVIVSDDVLHIIDYKHGLGILVESDHNPQMMCYALGAVELFDSIYDIRNLRITIFQPRRDNVSTFECTKEELLAWADNTLAPTAAIAFDGQGEFAAGDHCQFCKVKATC